MPAPRRLVWIGGAAVVLVVVVAVVALAIALREPAGDSRGAAGRDAGAASGAALASGASGAAIGSGATAEQLVAAAHAAVTAGNLAEARTLLARAYALDPAPSTLLQLAAAELATGHCREARRATQRVIDESPPEIAEPARQLLARIGRCD